MSLLSHILKKQSPTKSVPVHANQQILQSGQLLSNRYLVSEILGRGAMGEVYLAEDTVLAGVSVAVKVMSQPLLTKSATDKFAREAQISAFLGHHNVNIVRVLDFGIHDGNVPFYVMEYVYGTTLAEEIERQPLSVNRTIKLMSQVGAGLQSAHQGVLIEKKLCSVIHRDLKPGNIFLTNNSSFGEIAKILDFGIAECFLPNHQSVEAEPMGTLAYSSAEQLLGKKLEPSSDIYSFGITLFEMLTGQLPIQPDKNSISAWIDAHRKQPPLRVRQVAPHLKIPEDLESLIQKCLEKNIKQRFQTIQEVLDGLKRISESLGTNFPVAVPSHQDILDELFGAPDVAQPAAHPLLSKGEQPSDVRQTLVSTPATLNIQPAKTPLPQTCAVRQTPKSVVQKMAWPETKPIAEIVFTQTIQTPDIEQTSLWAMLNYAEQQWQSLPCHHIEFMVEFNPHPILAWITILHDPQGRMRCLPCFIDLGNPQGRRLIQNLIQQSEYLFVLFSQKDPNQPTQVSTFKISQRQQQFLHQNWSKACQFVPQTKRTTGAQNSGYIASRQKLKQRYQILKAELPQRLIQKAAMAGL